MRALGACLGSPTFRLLARLLAHLSESMHADQLRILALLTPFKTPYFGIP